MKSKLIGSLFLLFAAIGLASATIFMEVTLEKTSLAPPHVSIWRFMIAAGSVWITILFKKETGVKQESRPIKFLILGMVFGIAGFSAIFALNLLPSSIYVIILYIYPSLIVIYSLIVGKPVPKLIWLGLPLTVLGLFLTVFDFGSLLAINPLGFIITIVNALALAGYFILSERVFMRVSSKLPGTRWMLLGSMIFSLLWFPFLGLRFPSSVEGWLLLTGLGIFGTMVPLLLANIGLQKIGAARGSVIVSLQPVFIVLFSTLFLGETLSNQQWLGGMLVVAAVILLQLSADRKVHDEGSEGA